MINRLGELTRLFLKLGTISFGGPAAHIDMMEREVVAQRGWLSREYFLHLVGATNLIPGPNAVEMAAHVGFRRAGLLGSLAAGIGFSLPAVLISAALAVGYERYGKLPQVEPFLYGIKPAVVAIIFAALWRLGRKACRTWRLLLIGLGVAAASLLECGEVAALLVGSLLGVFVLRWTPSGTNRPNGTKSALLAGATVVGLPQAARAASIPVVAGSTACAAALPAASLWKLGLFFLKVGAVLYGGGYVLLAYLHGSLVDDYGWLSKTELLDAVVVGQITPGPLLSTVTFVGYLVAGFPGAAVATLGMLLPSFVFVALVNPLIPKLRSSRLASQFLDAVTAASIGLMAAVIVKLAKPTLVDWPTWAVAACAAVVALRFRLAPAWLVLGGAIAGKALHMFG